MYDMHSLESCCIALLDYKYQRLDYNLHNWQIFLANEADYVCCQHWDLINELVYLSHRDSADNLVVVYSWEKGMTAQN